jgi:hypothetical protein
LVRLQADYRNNTHFGRIDEYDLVVDPRPKARRPQ